MVRKTKLRAASLQLALWALIGTLIAYFGYHGVHGDRGLRAHRTFEAEIAVLNEELTGLETERKKLEARVARFEPNSVDRDILEEQTRKNLSWMHPNDRILSLPD